MAGHKFSRSQGTVRPGTSGNEIRTHPQAQAVPRSIPFFRSVEPWSELSPVVLQDIRRRLQEISKSAFSIGEDLERRGNEEDKKVADKLWHHVMNVLIFQIEEIDLLLAAFDDSGKATKQVRERFVILSDTAGKNLVRKWCESASEARSVLRDSTDIREIAAKMAMIETIGYCIDDLLAETDQQTRAPQEHES